MNHTRIPMLAAGLSCMLALSSNTALADYSASFRDRARVLSSTPVYERVNEPRRECWTEYERVTYRNGIHTGGAILGAIAGGLLGSTVGKGNGKVAAAAVGAATGAVIGDRLGDRDGGYSYEERPVERCRTTDSYRTQIVGYDVVYRYHGREFTARLPYDPGRWLAIEVSLSVAEQPGAGRWKESRNRWFDD